MSLLVTAFPAGSATDTCPEGAPLLTDAVKEVDVAALTAAKLVLKLTTFFAAVESKLVPVIVTGVP